MNRSTTTVSQKHNCLQPLRLAVRMGVQTPIRTLNYKMRASAISTTHICHTRGGVSHGIQSYARVGLYGNSTRLSIVCLLDRLFGMGPSPP